MRERALIVENTKNDNLFNRNGPRNASGTQKRKSNNYGAVKNPREQTKAQSKKKSNIMTERYIQILSDNESDDYNEHDDNDIEEENETNYATNDGRSTGSNDMAELIGLLQTKSKKKTTLSFNKFEHEQEARLEEARKMIDGENGIIATWAIEMEEITFNAKRKIDDRLGKENEYIKKQKLELERYQSSTTKVLDNLTKLHKQSQRLGRDLDNDLKKLYAIDQAELNEALDQFIKQQNHEDHDIKALKKRLYECLLIFSASPILYIILNAIFAQAALNVDYVTIEGLDYFKGHVDNSNPALKSINSFALKALKQDKPYSVTNTTVIPPNGDKREYLSYAPYLWPNCDGIQNVSDPQTQCPYKSYDGMFNPDVKKLSDPSDSRKMIDSVVSLSFAYKLNDGDKAENFARKAVQLLDVWFVNEQTSMLPDVYYGQVQRGPGEWKGREEGILDLRFYVYIPIAIKILENSKAWNDNVNKGLRKWFSDFSDWLINSELGKGAAERSNNHATFYIAQLATYLDLSGRTEEAKNVIKTFVDITFQNTILKSGEQPKESKRTKPFHYQCFNLEALTYIAKFSLRIDGINLWEAKTKFGGTIQNAVDFLVDLIENGKVKEDETVLLPALYKSRDYYGDKSGKYSKILNRLLQKTDGATEWWTIYSPESLEGVPKTGSASALLGSSSY
ncbi:4992_t:CDS:10, partial [Funneliformis geosporum]